MINTQQPSGKPGQAPTASGAPSFARGATQEGDHKLVLPQAATSPFATGVSQLHHN